MLKSSIYLFFSAIAISIGWPIINTNVGLEQNNFLADLPKFYTHDYLTKNQFLMYHHDYIWYKKNVLVHFEINNKTFNDSVQMTLYSERGFFPYFYKFQISVSNSQDSLILASLNKPFDSEETADFIDAINVNLQYFYNHDDNYYIARYSSEEGISYSFKPRKFEGKFHEKLYMPYVEIVISIMNLWS